MTHWTRMGAAGAALMFLGGCMQSAPQVGGGYGQLAPLTPAPSGQVYSSQLPPPPAAPVEQSPSMSQTTPQTMPGQVASTAPVTRESLVGAWRVSSGGGNCQIFMALTQWTGGYRAASRGCPGQVADVSAWDVSGSQVVLKDNSGNTVATLNNSGDTRFEGTTSGGTQISLYR
ncbi:hypothetical protein FPY71_18265 [Aureimonas fodinaquatilis]|uniref:Alkaline proteinase inhibitor/ Outer membrane lipoprotein Omp19 domain-containing protein n=1 Tax=Aureimonas fodinaquatilis TaxID=2565783 RepID=A0A5B0DN23_9HYPH|nr:protease inhibitor Inh/omp19 family protein [Aureimonas fodinaquatilis]KAA0968267.1 hypothetical protein FPY71_18265 [Aureimonas fodinaquatilis]